MRMCQCAECGCPLVREGHRAAGNAVCFAKWGGSSRRGEGGLFFTAWFAGEAAAQLAASPPVSAIGAAGVDLNFAI